MLGSLLTALACAAPQYAVVEWPSERPGVPAQPQASYPAAGRLELAIDRISYEPEGIELRLLARNGGEQAIELHGDAIFLAWDGLEYAPATGDAITLAPAEQREQVLRYRLGRPLTGVGAQLVVRGMAVGGRGIVELPELRIPPMPVVR